MLQLDDIRSFMQSFWIRHLNGRSFSTIAKNTSVAESTVKRFASGEPNIGFYNVYQIVCALGVPFTAFARELQAEELRRDDARQDYLRGNHVRQSIKVGDVNALSSYGSGSGTIRQPADELSVARASEEDIVEAAQEMIERAENEEALRGTLAEYEYQVDRQSRINRIVSNYLGKDHR